MSILITLAQWAAAILCTLVGIVVVLFLAYWLAVMIGRFVGRPMMVALMVALTLTSAFADPSDDPPPPANPRNDPYVQTYTIEPSSYTPDDPSDIAAKQSSISLRNDADWAAAGRWADGAITFYALEPFFHHGTTIAKEVGLVRFIPCGGWGIFAAELIIGAAVRHNVMKQPNMSVGQQHAVVGASWAPVIWDAVQLVTH